MLHLFGAKDIYYDRQVQREDNIEERMSIVFPNSIMLDANKEINELKVDQLTAWCIGWTHSYWGWYDFFINPSKVKVKK